MTRASEMHPLDRLKVILENTTYLRPRLSRPLLGCRKIVSEDEFLGHKRIMLLGPKNPSEFKNMLPCELCGQNGLLERQR